MVEPLGVALHALDLGRAGVGTTAAVFGSGPIGLLLLQALGVVGATTILATDRLSHRVAVAAAMGATHALDADEALAGRALTDRLPRGGVDVAFETAGEDDSLASAIDAVRPGGRIVIVGIPDGDRTSFTASTARRKGLTLLLCRRMEATDLPRAIALAETGRVQLGPLVSERCALSEWRQAFDALIERRGLKVVVEPQRAKPIPT